MRNYSSHLTVLSLQRPLKINTVTPENIRPRDERRSQLVELPKRVVAANAAAENAIFFCISIPGFLVSRFLCKPQARFPPNFV
jgi:hypothetical protein